MIFVNGLADAHDLAVPVFNRYAEDGFGPIVVGDVHLFVEPGVLVSIGDVQSLSRHRYITYKPFVHSHPNSRSSFRYFASEDFLSFVQNEN